MQIRTFLLFFIANMSNYRFDYAKVYKGFYEPMASVVYHVSACSRKTTNCGLCLVVVAI